MFEKENRMAHTKTYTFTGKGKGGKLLRLKLKTENPLSKDALIQDIAIHGDFFAHPEDAFDHLEQYLIGKPVYDIGFWFEKGIAEFNVTVYGLLPEDLTTAVQTMTLQGNGL